MFKRNRSAFAALLAGALLLSSCALLPSLSEEDDDPPLTRIVQSGEQAKDPSGDDLPDLSAFLPGGDTSGKAWDLLDSGERQQILDAARAEGYDISVGDDGSLTVRDPEGGVYVQNPDGTWTAQGESTPGAQFGDKWPENEYTKKLPKPDFELLAAAEDDSSFTAAFQSVGADQIRAYAQKVRAAGFTVNAEENDQEVYGMVIYTYQASSADGWFVSISFAAGSGAISISRE